MFQLVKVSKENQGKIFRALVTILVVLMYIWWITVSLQTQLNSYIITNNTELVYKDDTKVKVDHINEDNTLYLDDTTKVEGDQVDEYIMTVRGTGTYYIPDNKMSRELSWEESIDVGEAWIVLTISVYIIGILLTINCKGSKWRSIGVVVLEFFVSILTIVVGEYYVSNILQKNIPIQEIVLVVYILLALTSVLLRVFRAKIWRS